MPARAGVLPFYAMIRPGPRARSTRPTPARTSRGSFARALACAAVAAVLGAAPAAANVPDSGAFKIYQRGQAVGIESFAYVIDADSMLVSAHTRAVLPSVPDDTLYKDCWLVVSKDDYDLRVYRSQQTFRGAYVLRGLIPRDTVVTAYRQTDAGGEGATLVRPPGRLFIVDPFLYSMFDVIGRNLHDQVFESRPIQLFVMTDVDTVITARATDRGEEKIPWGGKPVTCRKLAVSDGTTEFILWISPIGRMLQLEEPVSGLRVEREPPPVKPRRRGG